MLVLIYLLVVGWFQSFKTPLVIMAPIPLTLAGTLPAHWLSGAFFTATSMIGMIALAGIIVRNSIRWSTSCSWPGSAVWRSRRLSWRQGWCEPTPSSSRVVGGAVMVQDPIFQGLGISMISGALVATLLTLVTIPLLYVEVN